MASPSRVTWRQSNLTRRGFTLIELVIVVAIIAILAMIAYPSYLEHIKRTRRNDAKSVLVEAAQWGERNFTIKAAYDFSSLPTTMQQSPRVGTAFYAIGAASGITPSSTTFTLEATPVGPMTGDKCGAFRIDQAGNRTLTGNTAPFDQCWDR